MSERIIQPVQVGLGQNDGAAIRQTRSRSGFDELALIHVERSPGVRDVEAESVTHVPRLEPGSAFDVEGA